MGLFMHRLKTYLPGISLASVLAVIAWKLGRALPIVGAPVFGILLGMTVAFWRRPDGFTVGIRFSSKQLLQYAIILLGFEMNLFRVLEVGQQTLVLMAFTLTVTFATAYIAGRILRLDGVVTTLIGVGTAICGGSAIAATAPVIGAADEEVAQSISTIFLFNVIAAFAFPFIGHVVGMNDHSFGVWAGTAINDTSSVVAAGYSYSQVAGDLAVIVKLTRTLAIIPVALALAFLVRRRNDGIQGEAFKLSAVFPWFVIGFLAASVITTFSGLPLSLTSGLGDAGKFMIVVAMAAIGLNTHVGKLIKSGGKPLLLGLVCSVVLAMTSLGAQAVLGI